MNTFKDYQKIAEGVAISLRNNRDRIQFPITELQLQCGKIGTLLAHALSAGPFTLTAAEAFELKDRLAEVLWCIALVCKESGMEIDDVAAHSMAQLQLRAKILDPDQR